MPTEHELPFPPVLLLAQSWAADMGRNARRGELLEGSARAPLLFIEHGRQDIFVRDHHDGIIVFLLVDIPEETKALFKALPSTIQRKALRGLRGQLLLQPRCSYALSPPDAETIVDLDRLSVEQILRIASAEPATFNRFADALQEVVNATARATTYLGAFLDGAGAPGRSLDQGPPPTGMYA